MIRNIMVLFLITFIPAFELRASIPVGVLKGVLKLPFGFWMGGMGLPWPLVFFICVSSNFLLGVFLYPVIDRLVLFLGKIPSCGRLWQMYIKRVQRKIYPYVERWGTLGVAFFIAVPLPGSGTYSGAIGAYLIGMSYKKFLLANALGVFLAGCIVTMLVMTGAGLFSTLH